MLIGLIAVSAAVLAWAAAGTNPLPAPVARGHGAAARRRRYLLEHPDRVNSLDVERRLARHLLPEDARDIARRALRLGYRPLSMWTWADRYGVELLVLAVRAGMGAPAFERHLARCTVPDRRALELFARLAPEVGALAPLWPSPSTKRLERQELRAFPSLPEIVEPGLGGHPS